MTFLARSLLIALPLSMLVACKPSATPSAPTQQARESLSPAPVASPPRAIKEEMGNAIHVSPSGSDKGAGSADAPLKTIEAALKKVPKSEGGTIVLHTGVYHETVSIPAANPGDKESPRLTILSAPGEEVVFEGGVAITEWEQDLENPRLVIVHAPDRETVPWQSDWFEVWENDARVRYRKVADRAAVAAWPGSVCLLDGERLLIHVRNGKTPLQAGLWRNRRAMAFSVSRSNVTLSGLQFQNYVGGSAARAVTLFGSKEGGWGYKVTQCDFRNTTLGISGSGHGSIIEDCRFDEVGTGIIHSGNGTEMTIRRCIFTSATGLFAFSDVSEHARNGIRIYYAGNGATIEQCVTAGFWAGLYIKTISGREGSLPYYITNNTFLDTFRSGAEHRHPKTYVRRNIIGPYVEASGVRPNGSYLREAGATLEENTYFGHSGQATGSDRSGPDPFVNLAKGDLRLRPDADLSAPAAELGATEFPKVQWNSGLASLLHQDEAPLPALAITRDPVVAASRQGAIITVAFSRPGKPTLLYRPQGETEWLRVNGISNTVVRPKSMAAAMPIEPQKIDSWSTQFLLLNGKLKPGLVYEYRVEAEDGPERVELPAATFSTTGGPKMLYVAASSETQTPDGTQAAPFTKIQEALDRALPGDTVHIGPGVYTAPLLLQHGGSAEAPLTIIGSGLAHSILDGGKEVGTMIELQNAPHVHLSGLQVRWFSNIGLHAKNSPYGVLERCWIWNQLLTSSAGRSGKGVDITQSAGWRVSGCLFNQMEHGIYANGSPEIECSHNTTFGNLYSGIMLRHSSRHSRIIGNSLNFTGNDSLVIVERDPAAFASLESDYNNFGTALANTAIIATGGTTRSGNTRPENDFTPAKRYGNIGQAKFMITARIGSDEEVFRRMEDWRRYSGKDAHSLFADPEFSDPKSADFHPLPHTPNRLDNGVLIGAFPIRQANDGTVAK